MAKPKLTKQNFCDTAKKLKCDVAAIKAVAQVESRGDGFYDDGFPVILFERHKFRAFTHGKFSAKYPQISGPQGSYGAAGQNQRNKFNLAFSLDPEAAMMSCSWGKFQVMGFNWDDLGYESIHEFVDKMKESEGEHLDAFARFVKANGLTDELRRLDWKGFARGYNGPAYAKNQYDTKMAAAYKKYKAENINCDEESPFADLTEEDILSVLPASPATPPKPDKEVTLSELQGLSNGTPGNSLAIESKDEQPGSTQIAEQIINTGDVPANFTPETVAITAPPATGFLGKLKAGVASLLLSVGGFAGIKEYFSVQLSPDVVEILKIAVPSILGLGFIGFLFWYVTEKVVGYKTLALKATLRSDPTKHNPVIVPAEQPIRRFFT